MRQENIIFQFNGQQLNAAEGETILDVAKRSDIEIPNLCYHDSLGADGNCRSCMVEIDGERVLAPSCCRKPTQGMVVNSDSERSLRSQRGVLELLLSDVSEQPYTSHSELQFWADKLKVSETRYPRRKKVRADPSHPAMSVNLDACIQCTRCLRACRDTQANDVIGYAWRGNHSKITFDLDDSMGSSSCVACGECVQMCPTGALMPAGNVGVQVADKTVDSVCPYCGVGCQTRYHINTNQILWVEGREGPANKSRLCVKGRFGFDYAHSTERLTTPMIRKQDAPKRVALEIDPKNPMKDFLPVSWEDAMAFAADGFSSIKQQRGAQALAGFGSAKGSNEEAYLFQKLIRTGFGTNNVDHCTRLCHASSVVALLEGIGSGAVSNPFADVSEAEVILIIGSNTTVNHPVAATFIKNEARKGKTLIVMDPVRTDIAKEADHHLQFHPDTDVAMLNGIMQAIIEADLVDSAFIESRTEDYTALKNHLKKYPPEKVAPICGVDANTLRRVAALYAQSNASIIFWGMGISQHIHGTDNARCLISLALMTGQIGRPGAGLHPLRGQNNVQGASDVGLIPMVFPDYQRVDDPATHTFFEDLWQSKLDSQPGLTVVEIMQAIAAGTLKGLYIMGENPAMSDPNLNHTRKALASLQHLVVQDIFFTETASYADVILPATAFPEKTGTFTNTDRRVQLGRQALDPPGEARLDSDIIMEMAKRMGLHWEYASIKDVFNEMRQAMPSIRGITWDRLEKESAVTYPCENEGDPGDEVIFTDIFPTDTGKARFVPAQYSHAAEMPDEHYPWVLMTGRLLEHWHTGAMTRRATVLDAIEPEPVASLHPDSLAELGVEAGDAITLTTKRGQISVKARADRGFIPSQVFMPFCYHEAAANLLTTDALDPDAKIPEFKFCAVKVTAPSAK